MPPVVVQTSQNVQMETTSLEQVNNQTKGQRQRNLMKDTS